MCELDCAKKTFNTATDYGQRQPKYHLLNLRSRHLIIELKNHHHKHTRINMFLWLGQLLWVASAIRHTNKIHWQNRKCRAEGVGVSEPVGCRGNYGRPDVDAGESTGSQAARQWGSTDAGDHGQPGHPPVDERADAEEHGARSLGEGARMPKCMSTRGTVGWGVGLQHLKVDDEVAANPNLIGGLRDGAGGQSSRSKMGRRRPVRDKP